MEMKNPKAGTLKVPQGAKGLGEKATKAIEIRKSAAKARQGKSLTFPTQLQRGR